MLLSAVSYSQNKIEPGTYVTQTEGQEIKLKLSDDNKFELVFFQGTYETKNDTLSFNDLGGKNSGFSVFLSSEANPNLGKVKVQLTGKHASAYASSLYIGTQSGKSNPVFKNISDYSSEINYNEDELNFEIDRADFFYLVNQDYNDQATLEKYTLPRNVNQIKFEYKPNYFGKVKLEGYHNEKKELVVVEKGKKNPLIFVLESAKKATVKSDILPLETKVENNWTFPGKRKLYDDYGAVDSTYNNASDYKLVIQNNLQKAMEASKKTPSKYLVISYDPDNKETKSEFDNFINNQQYSLGTYASYENTTEYDKYNYYLATSKDKSWFLKNKITDNPSTIVLDSEGNILAKIKGSLATNNYLFDVYYSAIQESLKQVKAISDLNKAISSKAKEKEVLKKMLPLSNQGSGSSLYPPIVAETTFLPPVVEEIVPAEDISEMAVDTARAYTDYYNQNEPVYTKINIDKNKLLAAWEKIVKIHVKDSKPDMDFVKVSLSEIENSGFYSKIFNEERLFDETNFKAIDYLLQNYDEILNEQKKLKVQDTMALEYDYYDTIEYVLPNAVTLNSYLVTPETSSDYQKRLLGVYKKMMEKQVGNHNRAISYFTALEGFSRNLNTEDDYVSEYDFFFNKTFKGTNEIEILDEMFSEREAIASDYSNWSVFKNSYANTSNQAAWFVVEKSKNPESIKKAIKWSESSLRIEKNNPYYLDTLAQLYYKNGEKQKAIATQEQALKYIGDSDEVPKQEMQTAYEKMKAGTY